MLDALDRFASRLFFWPFEERQSKSLAYQQRTFLLFLKYLTETYFDPSAQFNYKLWNHLNQFLTYRDPDCTTNCYESINDRLNKDCPGLRTPNAVFNKF